MSALSYFLEDEGIATTGISLVREHTMQMQPPRSLWVPFPLGRPLGVPNNAAFQHEVIAAAWRLLDVAQGPVLEDFATDAPPSAEPEQNWSCPVSFASNDATSDSVHDRVAGEIQSLAPWYAVSLEQRGRTSVGASKLDTEQALALVASALNTEDFDVEQFKYASEDLKAYYLEAMASTPGADINVNAWLWNNTALAQMYREIAALRADSNNETLATLIKSGFIPREFSS